MSKLDWGKILTSKTVWLNIIAFAIFMVQGLSGEAWMNPEIQATILTVLNLIVRFLTKDSLTKPPADTIGTN